MHDGDLTSPYPGELKSLTNHHEAPSACSSNDGIAD